MLAHTMSIQTTQMLTNDKARELFVAESKFQTPTEELTDVFNIVSRFVGDMGAEHRDITPRVNPHWLTLSGVSGCGKTMLAKEVFAFAEKHYYFDRKTELHRDIVFKTVLDLADEWRSGAWRNQFDEQAWFMVVDDIGSERDTTGFVKDRLFNLLTRRLGKWTLITTNLTFNGIRDSYDARLASRLIRDGNKSKGLKTSGDWWLRKENL